MTPVLLLAKEGAAKGLAAAAGALGTNTEP